MRSRYVYCFILSLALALAACVRLTWLGEPGPRFGDYALAYAALWGASVLLMLFAPRGLGRGAELALILLAALACRAALWPAPVSTDAHRYLWEGRVLAIGLSPYVHGPLDPLLGAARDALVWPRINNPEWTACYPPMVQGLFALVGRIWYAPAAVKAAMLVFDVGALLCLLALLAAKRLPLRSAYAYAVNPVVLLAFAAEAHLDALLVFGLTAALLCHEKRRWDLMFVALALAVQAKYVALLCLPFFLTRENWSKVWITGALIVLPFLFVPETGGADFFRSLTRLAGETEFNSSLYALLLALSGERATALLGCGSVGFVALVWAYARLRPGRDLAADPARGSLCVLAATILCAPVVYGWYLSWLAPLLVRRRAWIWLLPCLSVALSYQVHGVWLATGVWTIEPWARVLEWAPVWLAALGAAWLGLRRTKTRLPSLSARARVSVLIPTLREAGEIVECIRAVRRDPAVAEIIVADGGSELLGDDTVELAREAGALTVVNDAPIDAGGGRGGQLVAGLALARQEVVAIVHADSRPEPDLFSRALEALAANPEAVAGAAGGWFEGGPGTSLLVQWGNDARAGLFGLSFGDQLQFFRREAGQRLGLLQPLPLMEDVEFSLRALSAGPTLYLWAATGSSPRAWRSRPLSRAARIVYQFFRYLLARAVGASAPDLVRMYRNYYPSQPR